jgi:hypothetical protein
VDDVVRQRSGQGLVDVVTGGSPEGREGAGGLGHRVVGDRGVGVLDVRRKGGVVVEEAGEPGQRLVDALACGPELEEALARPLNLLHGLDKDAALEVLSHVAQRLPPVEQPLPRLVWLGMQDRGGELGGEAVVAVHQQHPARCPAASVVGRADDEI